MTRYRRWLEERRGLRFESYEAMWEWSVTEIESFWSETAANRAAMANPDAIDWFIAFARGQAV